MEYQYSYKYLKVDLSESEIYQMGAAAEELERAKKDVVNMYLDSQDNEPHIYQLCQNCIKDYPTLTYLDKAGDWDICDNCGAQNIPSHYHGEI